MMGYSIIIIIYCMITHFIAIPMKEIKSNPQDLNLGITLTNISKIPNPDMYLSLSYGQQLFECHFDYLAFDQPHVYYWCKQNSSQATTCYANEQHPDSATITATNGNNEAIYIDQICITSQKLSAGSSSFCIDIFNVIDHGHLETQDVVKLSNGSMSIQLTNDILDNPMKNEAILSIPEKEMCSKRDVLFIFVDSMKTQPEAQQYCMQNFGSDLATVDTPYEQHVAAYMMEQNIFKDVWMGLIETGIGIWQWVNGKVCCDNTPWAPAEPNELANEKCVDMNSQGTWNNRACNQKMAFVCNFNVTALPDNDNEQEPNNDNEQEHYINNTIKDNVTSSWYFIAIIIESIMIFVIFVIFMIWRYRRRHQRDKEETAEYGNVTADGDDEVENDQLQDNDFAVEDKNGNVFNNNNNNNNNDLTMTNLTITSTESRESSPAGDKSHMNSSEICKLIINDPAMNDAE